MKLITRKSKLSGSVNVPASKSHTIRAILIASFASGESRIDNPLFSEDTKASIIAGRALGADIKKDNDCILITGNSGNISVKEPHINVLNSGTTLRLASSFAGLGNEPVIFDGDESLRKRPINYLIDSLEKTGLKYEYMKVDGYCPIKISGGIRGGETDIEAVSSQFLSALLLALPLAENDSKINVISLNEKPYIDLTLKWLEDQDINFSNDNYKTFYIKGRQKYKSFNKAIPADFSSATFPICAAAVTESELKIENIDMSDVQGDKRVIDILKTMGADIEYKDSNLTVRGSELHGRELDINDIPDALPALCIIGCYASGKTVLRNVKQARLKECDRISVMARELRKMGAGIEELDDGIVIENSKLRAAVIDTEKDHRIIMAFSLAGMIADGDTIINDAEAISVTFPGYTEIMQKAGADFTILD